MEYMEYNMEYNDDAAYVDDNEYIKPEKFECEPVQGFKYFIKKRNGIHVPNTVISLACIKNLKPQKDDVFIIAYPRSGKHLFELFYFKTF